MPSQHRWCPYRCTDPITNCTNCIAHCTNRHTTANTQLGTRYQVGFTYNTHYRTVILTVQLCPVLFCSAYASLVPGCNPRYTCLLHASVVFLSHALCPALPVLPIPSSQLSPSLASRIVGPMLTYVRSLISSCL